MQYGALCALRPHIGAVMVETMTFDDDALIASRVLSRASSASAVAAAAVCASSTSKSASLSSASAAAACSGSHPSKPCARLVLPKWRSPVSYTHLTLPTTPYV